MNVLFLSPYSPRIVGGIGTFLTNLVEYLNGKGIPTIVVCPKEKGFKVNCRLKEISFPKIPFIGGLLYVIKSSVTVFSYRNSYDLIHVQTPHYYNVIPVLVARLFNIPVVTTHHGKKVPASSHTKNLMVDIGLKIIKHFSTVNVYVSYYLMKCFSDKEGLVIYNGIDCNRYKPNEEYRNSARKIHGIDDNNIVFLYAGRVAKEKGIFRFINISKKLLLEYNNIKCLVVGSVVDKDKKRFFKCVNDEQYSSAFRFVGKQRDTSLFFNMCDIYMLPSDYEGLPLTILESMSNESITVASNVGGIHEVISDGENGFFIDHRNLEKSVDTVRQIVANIGDLKPLKQNARNTIIKRFSLSRMSNSYLNLYRRLLSN